MADTSQNLNLPYILPTQAQKHVTHNEALRRLDIVTQLAVESASLDTPPSSPQTGDRYLVAPNGQGDWTAQDGHIAVMEDGAWSFETPQEGWLCWVRDSDQLQVYDGVTWTELVPEMPETVALFGIATTADANNPLSVSGPGTLLTNAGSDHRLTVNKAAAGDTASLVFQTGWSGRAELGTTGSDDLSIKVSADGNLWQEALTIGAATGMVSGLAVQQAADDTTAGRLMRADYGFGPGNLLGTVSEASGTPTGAVIERGSNADGEFVKFADGTLICTRLAEVSVTTTSYQGFKFAAPFSAVPAVSFGHIHHAPNPAIEFGAVRSVSGWTDPWQEWGIALKAAGTPSNPIGNKHTLSLTAIGRWF